MSFIAKPAVPHHLPLNKLGLAERDYEGSMSTLCAGCGHDSITAAIVQAFFELSISPQMVAKLSGIGCSSKTPTYFLSGAHGFNSVHGRMPSIATGANAARQDMIYIGVSGDGDSMSIGLGQFCHAIRRNLNMLYVLENNGVYGLTKGQFSAAADRGSRAKRGEENIFSPIDPVKLALSIGATFVARSFSGDKKQLVPILKAAIAHKGFALIDIISPCVTFNDHQGSTKSYLYTRKNYEQAIIADYVPQRDEIAVEINAGETQRVRLHDGSEVHFANIPDNYDPTDHKSVQNYLEEHASQGKVVTGLLYIEPHAPDLHAINNSVDEPLAKIKYPDLCPGKEKLATLMKSFQ
jgi:2-oxoglutarate/2-oxoacid ferredoxin oxidoreductase subunit beta